MATDSPFRNDCLQGKIAVITGGGSGIGFEITRQLLRHGCAGVIICGRRSDFLQRAVDRLQDEDANANNRAVVRYQVCDVRKPEQCQKVMQLVETTFGSRLDILVNGAAGNFLAEAQTLSPKGFETVMAIDALGTFNMTRAAYNLLRQSGDAVVINISATLQYGATWWQAHASAAKSAVDSLTRSWALEWGSQGIRVVGIAPGPIANTPGTTKLAPTTAAMTGDSPKQSHKQKNRRSQVSDLIQQHIPLGRMGETWEIGHAAVYLCTAKYVTGDVLVVDGGQWLYKEPLVPREMVAALSRQVEAQSRAQRPAQQLSKL